MIRSRLGFFCVLVAASLALVSGSTASSATGPARSAAVGVSRAPSIGNLVLAPRRDAILLRSPVRARFHVPHGTRLRVEVNRRVVGLRARGSAATVAVSLTRRNGLRFGNNTVFVTALRGRRRVAIESRSFTLSRRAAGMARIRVSRATLAPGWGQEAGLIHVRVVAGRPVARGLLASPRAYARSLAAARRPRRFSAWLNGRDVTSLFTRRTWRMWSADLSATHGLRPGANRLRVLVVDLGRGQHTMLSRTIRLSRSTPLAGAGADQRIAIGARVRFGAGSSVLGANAAAVRYRWRLIQRPRGSHARLHGATGAHPWLIADRLGTYRARLAVSKPRPGAGMASGMTSADDVDADVVPGPLVDGVDTMAKDAAGHWGIRIGDTFYPNPSPSGDAMQVLVLNRKTLQPQGDRNWYTDGTDNAAVGIPALHAHVVNYTPEELVILAQPPTGHVPVQPGEKNRLTLWHQILDTLSAADFTSDQITQAGKSLSVIGVPFAAVDTAWQTATSPGTAANGPAALQGSLIASAGNYTFSPKQIAFDSSSASASGQNTIAVGVPGSPFASSLPFGSTYGLQVLALDNATLAVKLSRAYALDGTPAGPSGDVAQLHADLAAAVKDHDLVFVQTIGNAVSPGGWEGNSTSTPAVAWNLVSNDLVALGASLPLVNAINGSYTLVGGAALTPDQVQEASSAFPLPGQPPTPSRLRGWLTIDHTGRWHAQLADPTGFANLDLYPVIHQPPQPWPLTGRGDPADQKAYRAADTDITNALDFNKWGNSIRDAYYLDDNFPFTTEHDAVDALTYKDNPNYTATQFANLKTEIGDEIDMLAQVKQTLFDGWKEPFLRAQGGELVDLNTLGTDIQKDINPPNDSVGIDLTDGILGAVLDAAAPGLGDEGLAAVSTVTSAMELATSIGDSGSPQADRVQAKVDDLATTVADSYNVNAGALDSLRDVVFSDYGKLRTMDDHTKDPRWAATSPAIGEAVPALKAAAQRMFYAQLMPLAYRNFYLFPASATVPQPVFPSQCTQYDAAASSWRTVTVSFSPSKIGYFDSDANRRTWMLATPAGYGRHAPAQWLTDPLVTPVGEQTREPNPKTDRDGLGVVLEQFLAQYFPPPKGTIC